MPFSREELDRELGHLEYQQLPGGKLKLDQGWIDAHLVCIDAPWDLPPGWGGYASRSRCHKRATGQLLLALQELQARALVGLIETSDGVWTARLVTGGSTQSLDCWGHALDLNASKFPLGSSRRQDPQLVAIMADHGFECGQVWEHRKDPMHFEAIRFLNAVPVTSDQVAILVAGAQVATGRLEGGHVVGPVGAVAQALGRRVTWDGMSKHLSID